MSLHITVIAFMGLYPCAAPATVSGEPAGAGPSGTITGTVVDGVTGQPAPCTVEIAPARGGAGDRASYPAAFRCDGRFRKAVPAGRARVRVTRGLETRAIEREADVPAGGEADARIALERVVDLRKLGWFAGDSHAHMLHGERTVPVTFDDVALAARAEDLAYLSLAQAWILADPTPGKLAAELGARSGPDCALTWNLEQPKNYYRGDATRCLGHCWTLGMGGRTAAGEDVIRLLIAASAHDYESDKPPVANFESHRVVHATGGAVFYTHAARWWTGTWGGQGGYPKRDGVRISNMAVELPLDTLVGPSFDGMDVITTGGEIEANEKAFDLWCLLLDHGYRVAATGSSDSCFDRPGGATPGAARTCTKIDGAFSLPEVARATAAGHTFVTTGPLLLASVEDRPPGSTFPADGKERRIDVEAWASGADPVGLTRLELFRNGVPARAEKFSPAVPHVRTSFPVAAEDGAWYCVRAWGGDRRQRAIGGAFFFDREPHRPPAPARAHVRIELRDAATGAPVAGTVAEALWPAVTPAPDAARTPIPGGEGTAEMAADARLVAEAQGYRPATMSPFFDHAPLVEFITGLAAEDLLRWETFERIRALLGDVRLTFRLVKAER